ncbi:MAG TPA: hypothetical protein VFD82_04465 [Planctomycetota bacterium]|nr:hypothetical protein [Planctomycetota bacterium]
MALAWMVAGLLGSVHEARAQEATARVVVTVPAHRAEGVRAWLSAHRAGFVVEPAENLGEGPLSGSRLLLFWDEWTLARHSASLRPIAPRAGSPAAEPFVLEFAGDYALAVATSVPTAAGPGRAWHEIAMDEALAGRLGIVAPEVDGSPWLLAMRDRLERGEPENIGLAWWTALDARAGTLSGAYAPMLEDLIGGRLGACLGPRDLLRAAAFRSAGRVRVESIAGPNGARFGLAVTADATAPVLDAARWLADPDRVADLAAVVDMFVAGETPAALSRDIARRWWDCFQRDVRGRGRATERLADWLDLVFFVLFLVCMVFVWRSMRKEGPPARSRDSAS